ncbi:MAG: hypothetical protein Q4G40_03255 [Brachybacterium sp.]|nr:hypothetical protein [Brachybacterium sp.]
MTPIDQQRPRPALPGRRSVLGAAAGAMLLASCGTGGEAPPAVPSADAPAEPLPRIDLGQLETVLEEVAEHLQRADDEHDAELLAPRVSGSAAAWRRDGYAILPEVPEHAQEFIGPSGQLVLPILPGSDSFPRSAIALAVERQDEETMLFVALQQADARSNYASWGWARQQGGADMPSVPADTAGAEAVDPDDDGLVMSPREALAAYARALEGAEEDIDQVEEDPFGDSVREEIAEETEVLQTALLPAEGEDEGDQEPSIELQSSWEPVEDEIAALRTADGGAVVMGSLTGTRSVTISGGTLVLATHDEEGRPNPAVIIAGGEDATEDEDAPAQEDGVAEFSSTFTRTYGTTVALFVPAADSGERLRLIGASRMLVSADGA